MPGADCRLPREEDMKTKIRTIKYLTQDELKRLFMAIENKRDRAIFLIAYRHGLRASEVGMIRPEDVDLTRGRIRVERLKNSLGGEHPMHIMDKAMELLHLRCRTFGDILFEDWTMVH